MLIRLEFEFLNGLDYFLLLVLISMNDFFSLFKSFLAMLELLQVIVTEGY
jgi:hypothetical protein